MLNRDTWSDDVVQNLVASGFIFWQVWGHIRYLFLWDWDSTFRAFGHQNRGKKFVHCTKSTATACRLLELYILELERYWLNGMALWNLLSLSKKVGDWCYVEEYFLLIQWWRSKWLLLSKYSRKYSRKGDDQLGGRGGDHMVIIVAMRISLAFACLRSHVKVSMRTKIRI